MKAHERRGSLGSQEQTTVTTNSSGEEMSHQGLQNPLLKASLTRLWMDFGNPLTPTFLWHFIFNTIHFLVTRSFSAIYSINATYPSPTVSTHKGKLKCSHFWPTSSQSYPQILLVLAPSFCTCCSLCLENYLSTLTPFALLNPSYPSEFSLAFISLGMQSLTPRSELVVALYQALPHRPVLPKFTGLTHYTLIAHLSVCVSTKPCLWRQDHIHLVHHCIPNV